MWLKVKDLVYLSIIITISTLKVLLKLNYCLPISHDILLKIWPYTHM